MSWHLVGTYLDGMLTSAFALIYEGTTIILLYHIPVKLFLLYHLDGTLSSSYQVSSPPQVSADLSILLMQTSVVSK